MKYDLKGYNSNNLIKTLISKKVKLYNIEIKSYNEFSFEIDDKDVGKVKRYISNYKFKQTLTKIKKLPSFLLANLGVILGVFIGSIFFIFASNFTWQIQVYGTEELSITDIINVLKQNNIKTGKINLQTSEEIETILLNNYDRIAQVSVIREGTAIIINLSEKLVYIEEEFQPIRAKTSGIITDINIISGTTNVRVGDYVNKGDVLVLPFNINTNGEKVRVRPIAEISAKMFIIGKCELNKQENVLVRTGNTIKTYQYKFNNLNLFSSKVKNSFALFDVVVYNENISGLVPLKRDVYVYYELETQTKVNDFELEKENLMQKSLSLAKNNMLAGEIVDEKTEVFTLNDKMTACTTITVIGNIND